MSYTELFELRSNPFRLTPAVSPDEIIWAGFHQIKLKFENRIKRAIKIPNSSLVLNWGEYGSGKTHAGRFFGKQQVLQELATDASSKMPFFLFINLPKGKTPVEDFFISIIDKIDIVKLRKEFKDANIEMNEFIDSTVDNLFIGSVAKAFFNDEIEGMLFRRYLYNSTNASDKRILVDYGIQRDLNPETDYSKLLATIFSCLTFNKAVYSAIILWIDEFEDISILTKVNGDKTNSFLRELLDNTPNNLLLFLNLTQSSFFNIEDLGEYISEALKSRIKDRINFEIPNNSELLVYVDELLTAYRFAGVKSVKEKYYPFSEDLLLSIFKDLGNVSLRKVNEALGILIELAEIENVSPIDLKFYEANKNDVVGWKG